jgi:hypothetical protein
MRRVEVLIVNGLEVACRQTRHLEWIPGWSVSTTANWRNGLGHWINAGPLTVGRCTKLPVQEGGRNGNGGSAPSRIRTLNEATGTASIEQTGRAGVPHLTGVRGQSGRRPWFIGTYQL